jgi:hypothetical protein
MVLKQEKLALLEKFSFFQLASTLTSEKESMHWVIFFVTIISANVIAGNLR